MTKAKARKRARSAKPTLRTRRRSTTPGPGKGRKVGQTTPAIAAAARAAGELGGRPPAKLPAELLADLGAPPTGDGEDAWYGRAIGVVTYGVLKGEPWKGMLESLIRAAAQATKSNERAIRERVAVLLEKEDREINEDHAPRMIARKEDPIAKANRGAVRRDPT